VPSSAFKLRLLVGAAHAPQVSGEVLYNGHTKEQFVVQRTAAFVDQHDSHIANMSVAETVEFAHLCHTGYSEPAFHLPGELRKAKVSKREGQRWGRNNSVQVSSLSAVAVGSHETVAAVPTCQAGFQSEACVCNDWLLPLNDHHAPGCRKRGQPQPGSLGGWHVLR
jgi:hypothetical protein